MPDATVTPYGSVLDPDLVDGWSDLDVEVQARREFDVEDVLAAPIWAFQEAYDATGTVHHRTRTSYDDRAREASAVVAGPLCPDMARASYELYGRWRAENEPDHAPDPTGLDALMARAGWVPRDAHDAIRAELDADTDEYRDTVPEGEWAKPNRR